MEIPYANVLLALHISLLTFILIFGFTSATSRLRPVGLLPMLLPIVVVFQSDNRRPPYLHPVYAAVLGATTVLCLLKYFGAMVQGWTYDAGGPTRTLDGAPIKREEKRDLGQEAGNRRMREVLERLRFATSLALNYRFAGTAWETRNVPPFDPKELKHVPSRTDFLWRNTLRVAVYLLILDLFNLPSRKVRHNIALFDQSKVHVLTRLHEITAGEVLIRSTTSVFTGAVIYLLFQALYSAAAVVAVGLGISRVEAWRPLFGNITEVWSLRQAWK